MGTYLICRHPKKSSYMLFVSEGRWVDEISFSLDSLPSYIKVDKTLKVKKTGYVFLSEGR